MSLGLGVTFIWKPPAPRAAIRQHKSCTVLMSTKAVSTCRSPTVAARPLLSSSLGVVITGSTKGVGRALAEEFVKRNDGVIVMSRTPELVDATVSSLRQRYPSARVFGFAGDISKHSDVARLTDFAAESLGTIDTFICNAGTVGQRGLLKELDPRDVETVVGTNLLGPLYCAKEVQRVAQGQNVPLHMFIMDGSGTRGNSTPFYAAYGATKRCVPQLISSLSKEVKEDPIRFHALSPGMVLTDLLLGGNMEPQTRKIFNFLAEEPETVAEYLVPKIRDVVVNDKSNTYIQFLTPMKAAYQLLTGFLLGFRLHKFFDPVTGSRVDTSKRYELNGVRIKDE